MALITKTYKLLLLIPVSVGLQIGVIKCLNFVYEWGLNYSLLVALIFTLILSVGFSTIVGTFFIYFSRRDYEISIYSFTPILAVCLYYSVFVFGFIWLTALILFYPFMYLGGIRHHLINDLGYQLHIQIERESERNRQLLKELLEIEKEDI